MANVSNNPQFTPEQLEKFLSPALLSNTKYLPVKEGKNPEKVAKKERMQRGVGQVFSNMGLKIQAGYARLKHFIEEYKKTGKKEWMNNAKVLAQLNSRLQEINSIDKTSANPDLKSNLEQAVHDLAIIRTLNKKYIKGHKKEEQLQKEYTHQGQTISFKKITDLSKDLETVLEEIKNNSSLNVTTPPEQPVPAHTPPTPHPVTPRNPTPTPSPTHATTPTSPSKTESPKADEPTPPAEDSSKGVAPSRLSQAGELAKSGFNTVTGAVSTGAGMAKDAASSAAGAAKNVAASGAGVVTGIAKATVGKTIDTAKKTKDYAKNATVNAAKTAYEYRPTKEGATSVTKALFLGGLAMGGSFGLGHALFAAESMKWDNILSLFMPALSDGSSNIPESPPSGEQVENGSDATNAADSIKTNAQNTQTSTPIPLSSTPLEELYKSIDNNSGVYEQLQLTNPKSSVQREWPNTTDVKKQIASLAPTSVPTLEFREEDEGEGNSTINISINIPSDPKKLKAVKKFVAIAKKIN